MPSRRPEAKGVGKMVFGTSRRREKVERMEAAAEAPIRDLGDGAYHEALGREHEAALAKDWANVARAVARQTGSRIGFDLSTQLAMNTFFVLDREPGEPRKPQFRKPEPEHQADRNAVPRPQPFRIQFIGATPDSGSSILREVEIRASDVPQQSSPPQWPRGRPKRSNCASLTATARKSLSDRNLLAKRASRQGGADTGGLQRSARATGRCGTTRLAGANRLPSP